MKCEIREQSLLLREEVSYKVAVFLDAKQNYQPAVYSSRHGHDKARFTSREKCEDMKGIIG